MRFRFVPVLALLALSGAALAAGPDITLLNAVTVTGASATSLNVTGPGPLDRIWVQSSGTYGVGTTVKIQTSRNGTDWTDAVAALATGEMWRGEACECLVRANVTVHEGGGKTVTVKAWVAGNGNAVAQ